MLVSKSLSLSQLSISHLIRHIVHCVGASVARQDLTDLHNLLGLVLLSLLLLLLGGGHHVGDLSYQRNRLHSQIIKIEMMERE